MPSQADTLIELIRRRRELEPEEPMSALSFSPRSVSEELPLQSRELGFAADIDPTIQQESPVDKLMRIYGEVPKEEGYKPGIGRNILAGILAGVTGAGAGVGVGAEVGRGIREAPYNTAYNTWLREKLTPATKQYELSAAERKAGLEKRRAATEEIGPMASLMRALNQIETSTPEFQGSVAEARARGELGVKARYEKEMEDIRQTGRAALATTREKGLGARQEKELTTRKSIADANRISRERIAELNRKMREVIANKDRTQFTDPSDQGVSQSMAEHEIAIMSDPDLLENLFRVDDKGFYHLLPRVDEEYEADWEAAKYQIDKAKKRILSETRTIPAAVK